MHWDCPHRCGATWYHLDQMIIKIIEPHYGDVIMSTIASQITSLTIVYSAVYSDAGEFPAQRPVTRSFDVFFDLRLNKQLNKQSWGWWFKTQSSSLWRHCNVSARFGCFVAVKSSFLVISRETFTFIFRVVLELRQLLYDYLIACAVTLKEIETFIWYRTLQNANHDWRHRWGKWN